MNHPNVEPERPSGLIPLEHAVSGNCGVCNDYDLHDFYDCHLRELVCAGCGPFVIGAESVRSLCYRGSEPLAPEEMSLVAKLFERGRSLSI